MSSIKYLLITVICSFCFFGSAQKVSGDSLVFALAPWQKDTIMDGVVHEYYHFDSVQIFNSMQNIHLLRVKNGNSKTNWMISTGSKELIKTSKMAAVNNAVAGVNGSFFNTKNGGSVNFIRINNVITDTSTQDKGPGIYGQNQSGALAFNDTSFVILERQSPWSGKWEEQIPYPNVMECGPLLLKDRNKAKLLDSPFNNNRHPRTCVCTTEEEVIVLTADGRNASAQGLSLHELTVVLLWLGCKNGLNLDGGGSTTFYISDSGIVNMPSDNKLWDHEGERPVSNALLLMSNDIK
ncbi:MAG: phosphodiester glycosidase family protein [Saprospiraceae bacterium]|jgi:exopolysaccharide biosynthesis protein|nr:phosphodiester glycosidase family protein [Saprospiraceae bacterium]MBL0023984.1 phosphodiester glycosidase family protein [Saprospiraceae bacterium]